VKYGSVWKKMLRYHYVKKRKINPRQLYRIPKKVMYSTKPLTGRRFSASSIMSMAVTSSGSGRGNAPRFSSLPFFDPSGSCRIDEVVVRAAVADVSGGTV
jgi:hypothetical protein